MVSSCATPSCRKRGVFVCPTCKSLGLPPTISSFCSQDCFKGSWPSHKPLHKMMTHMIENKREEEQVGNPTFDGFEFTGTLRPATVMTPMRSVPNHIAKPDYWKTGIPVSEQKHDGRIPVCTKQEIQGIRQVCRLGREVLDITSKALCVGTTGEALDRILHEACLERGCYPSPLNYYNFPKAFCVSVNEVICHGIPDTRPFEDGDIVNLDVSVYKDGYHADLNETFLVGKVDDEGVQLVKTAFECLQAALSQVKPGTMYRELGKYISSVATEHNFSVVKAWGGHGIGTLFHGPPTIPHYAKNKAVGVMKPGHIFTIEPMINVGSFREKMWPDGWTATTIDGLRSAQFEHTILVTDDGYEILTARENEPVMVWDETLLRRS